MKLEVIIMKINNIWDMFKIKKGFKTARDKHKKVLFKLNETHMFFIM